MMSVLVGVCNRQSKLRPNVKGTKNNMSPEINHRRKWKSGRQQQATTQAVPDAALPQTALHTAARPPRWRSAAVAALNQEG